MKFVNSSHNCHMHEVKEHLTTVLDVLRVGKSQRGSMEVFLFHRNITKPFAHVTSS